ncbi:hypothetical protein PCASD_23086 [Puccinia coronata f. sp. avenae]|uniref:Uncharacterized protein n=1 Tax=Puccinia coronata f. sp. avenae TaxID=200324 RepID=A0A2N5TPP9_9BASI|nr:hypothetical protein PCASD_23086 [Puccinia coronata f. sp. avenae]
MLYGLRGQGDQSTLPDKNQNPTENQNRHSDNPRPSSDNADMDQMRGDISRLQQLFDRLMMVLETSEPTFIPPRSTPHFQPSHPQFHPPPFFHPPPIPPFNYNPHQHYPLDTPHPHHQHHPEHHPDPPRHSTDIPTPSRNPFFGFQHPPFYPDEPPVLGMAGFTRLLNQLSLRTYGFPVIRLTCYLSSAWSGTFFAKIKSSNPRVGVWCGYLVILVIIRPSIGRFLPP